MTLITELWPHERLFLPLGKTEKAQITEAMRESVNHGSQGGADCMSCHR